jgi:predicted 3-demethylubiquinone-9 3-methyltransferase (glyoxalase superfamily)
MATAIRPFLMFQKGDAEEAMKFYVSLFADGEIVALERFEAGQPGKEGAVKRGLINIAKQTLQCFDSPAKHAFDFTPASSLFVDCESEAEIDRVWSALSEGGTALMPIGSYGFSKRFGWVNDRFGVSWQLNLA